VLGVQIISIVQVTALRLARVCMASSPELECRQILSSGQTERATELRRRPARWMESRICPETRRAGSAV